MLADCINRGRAYFNEEALYMQLWEYIPVLLGTGGFVAMLDDLSDGYIYRCKPVRIFVTACIAAVATTLCWFVRIFVPVFMVCGIIYVAEVLYSLRAHFVYVYSKREKTEDIPQPKPTTKAIPQSKANMRLTGEGALYPMLSFENSSQQRPRPVPLYNYSYSRRISSAAKEGEPDEVYGYRKSV